MGLGAQADALNARRAQVMLPLERRRAHAGSASSCSDELDADADPSDSSESAEADDLTAVVGCAGGRGQSIMLPLPPAQACWPCMWISPIQRRGSSMGDDLPTLAPEHAEDERPAGEIADESGSEGAHGESSPDLAQKSWAYLRKRQLCYLQEAFLDYLRIDRIHWSSE